MHTRDYPASIRVLFAKNPPDAFDNCGHFPILQPSVDCPFPGWSVEIFSSLMQALQVQIEPLVFENSPGNVDWGSLQLNNSWSGALGFLQNGTVDAICLQFQRTTNRERDFDFTYPITFIQAQMIVPEVDGSYTLSLLDVFKPFTGEAWLFFGISLIVCLLIFIFVSHVERVIADGKKKDLDLWETTWGILAFQMYQPSPSFQLVSDGGKILYTIFGIVHILLLMGLYQSYLITALLQPGDPYPFRNLEQMSTMIKSKEYQLLESDGGNWIYDEIRTSPIFSSLRQALEKNPALMVTSDGELVPTAQKGKYVFFSQIDAYTSYQMQDYCGLLTVTEDLPQVTSHFLFQKNSSFVAAVNKYGSLAVKENTNFRQIILQQSFIMRTYTKYFESGFNTGTKHVICPASTIDDITPLALRNCAGIFWLLFIGLGLSLFALSIEILVFRLVQRLYWKKKAFSK